MLKLFSKSIAFNVEPFTEYEEKIKVTIFLSELFHL